MNKLKILLALLALFVVLTAPAYFENPETDATRGRFAADGGLAINDGARAAPSIVSQTGESVPS